MTNPDEGAAVVAAIDDAVRRGDSAALATYANTADAAGNRGVAIILWQQVVAIRPTVESMLALAELLEKEKRDSEAVAVYERAVQERPADPHLAQTLADCAVKVAAKQWATDLPAAVQGQERALTLVGRHPKARMAVLRQLMLHKEWSERIRHGQPPYHAFAIEEMFFHHARPLVEDLRATAQQVVEAFPREADPRVTLAAARFCLGDRQGAEEMIGSAFPALRGSIWETMKFAPKFYNELRRFTDEDLVRGLPPVVPLAPMQGSPAHVVYLSCNYSYFIAFALPMVASLRERAPSVAVHLHVMDPPAERVAFIAAMARHMSPLAIAISIENPGLQEADLSEARAYYHAVRFIRFHAHLQHYRCPLWLMDVDGVINRDLGPLLQRIGASDVALRVRPARIEPWNQFNACMVGVNTTPAARDYFRLIAAYIAFFFQRKALRWGIDQMAMYGAYADMKDRGDAPSLAFLGERDVDYEYHEDGYLWPNSGAGKHAHMNRIRVPGAPAPNAPATKFDETFERYWQETVRIAAAVGAKL